PALADRPGSHSNRGRGAPVVRRHGRRTGQQGVASPVASRPGKSSVTSVMIVADGVTSAGRILIVVNVVRGRMIARPTGMDPGLNLAKAINNRRSFATRGTPSREPTGHGNHLVDR